MKQLITIAAFETELRNALSEIIKEPSKIEEFMSIQVESSPEPKPLMSFSWKTLGSKKLLLDEKTFDNMIILDKENTIKLFSKGLSNELLTDEAVLKLFNHIEDKNNFYKKIISFKSLLQCDKINIPIWKNITLKNDEEILLPLYVWNSESIKKNINPALDTEGKIKFFDKNISKWFTMQTEKTSNAELISRIAYRVATEQKSKNYIKKLGLYLNTDHQYVFNDGKKSNIKSLLFTRGLIKLIPLDKKTNPLDLVDLIRSKIPSEKREQITTQKKFAALWFKYLKETDFSYTDKIGNLANHTFKSVSQYYLPLIDIHNDKELKFDQEFVSNKTQLSLYRWLNLLHEKNVDFTHKDHCGISAITSLIIQISVSNYDRYDTFLKENSFMMDIWHNLKQEQKKEIFSQYIEQWNKVEKLITPELSQQKYSYQSPHIISEIMNLFNNADLFDNKEINTMLLKFFTQYDNVKGISDTIKQINHQQLKLSFPEKNITENRKIKI